MCGRFVLFSESLLDQVGELPGITEVHAPQGLPGPRYNLAPTQIVPIIRVTEHLAEVEPARWGLIPHWKKDTDGPPLFNARGETVASKPSFRDAFKARGGSGRCLIPLDGYYEWYQDGKTKQPYFVRLRDNQMLWAAGLYSTGLDQLSATMVTTESAEPIAWLHGRLPRFLLDSEIETWLQGSPDEAAQLLHPAPPELSAELLATPVDKAVGNVANDYPELIETE